MTNIKMRAVDTLHVSAVGPDNIAPGAEFEISKVFADDLEKRGLAVRVEEKAEPPVENKMDAPVENKAAAEPAAPPEIKPADAEPVVSRRRRQGVN